MASALFKSLAKAMKEFVQNTKKYPDSVDSFWPKLRVAFIEVKNKGLSADLSPEIYENLQIIKTTKGFKENIGEDLLYSIYPAMKLQNTIIDFDENMQPMIHIRAPAIPVQKSPRNSVRKSFVLDTRNIPSVPQTARSAKPKPIIPADVPLKPFPPVKQKRIEPTGEFVSSLKQHTEKIVPPPETPWNDNFVLNNETDALTYVGAMDPKNDFLQFHVGKVDNIDPYSFRLWRRLEEHQNEFQSMTRRGVFSANDTGTSDFMPIDTYVTDKMQYNMVSTIKFFADFKINKYFKFWRNQTMRKTFSRRLESFMVTCWNAKPSFPPVHFKIRNDLAQLKDYTFFPIKENGEIEFEKEAAILDNAREDIADKIGKLSKSVYESLHQFAKDVNSKYSDLVTLETVSYIDDKKIPSDFYYLYKVPRKKSLSMVEEKQNKIDHIIRIQKAKSEVEKIRNFFMVCDKTVLQYFLTIIEKQYHVFAKTFYDSSHQMMMHLELNYRGNDIGFVPDKKEMLKLVNDHVDQLFSYFAHFTRPCLIDPQGSGNPIQMSPKTKSIRAYIETSPQFANDYKLLNKMISDSYNDAEETLKLYQTSSRFIYDFKENWEAVKKKEDVDPSIYINNIMNLTNTLEEVETFKGTYIHKLLLVDVRSLRNYLVDFIKNSIQENNSILFRKFESICTNFIDKENDMILSMKYMGESLKENAEYSANIAKAENEIPNLKNTIELVNSIFNRAQTSVPLLVPNLLLHLKNVRNSHEKFEESLNNAKEAVKRKRAEVINQLKEKQVSLESKLKDLEQRQKDKFSKVDLTVPPEDAINNLENIIEDTDGLIAEIETFKTTAYQLDYNEYNFDVANKIKAELTKSLDYWKAYNNFMIELTRITESKIIDVNIPELIKFINQHSEREMRSVHHPLYDRMANHYALLYQYMPFFNIISKIEMRDDIWDGIFDILKRDKSQKSKVITKDFLDQNVIAASDEIKIYIMNLQQQADLSQTFDKYILQMKALVLEVKPSLTIKPPIITFPSIYEALTTCESFQLYLRTLKDSQFYTNIEKQVLYWEAVLYQLGRVFYYLLQFQTKYVILSEATSALFGEIHFAHEEQAKAFVDIWYNDFIKQVKLDPHVMQLIVPVDPNNPQASDPRHKKVVVEAINFSEVLHRDFKKESLDTKEPEPIVNKDYGKPIYCGKEAYYRGETLVQCLDEGTTRCEYIMSNSTYLLDQQRQKFPRFFFCTDKNVIDIMLACTNIKFIVNDLIPIFPSLSHFQTTTNKGVETIMGIIATNGEMIQFRSDFPYTGLQVVDILQRVEEEMQTAVRASILDAISAREYTPPKQWMIRYPTQSLLIGESTYFSQVINSVITRGRERTDWDALINKNNEFVKAASEIMAESASKCSSIAALTAMKIRHRDILEELRGLQENLSPDTYAWKRHLRHSLTNATGQEEIMTNIGNLSFRYGYELISHADIGPLTDTEDEAMLALASCMLNAEFSVCKQMNGSRNILKAFADSCGLPLFKIGSKYISNVFPGAASCKCVIRLTDVKDLPAAFPNFFGLLESQSKVMKCETHFRKLELNKWQTLIHVDEEKVPTWLMTRLRPIYLQNIPSQEFIKKINMIRPDIPIPSTISTEYLSMAIKQYNARGLINGYTIKEEGLSQHVFYFDVGEYILTGQLVVPKESLSITIPTFIKVKIDELTRIFDKFDAFAPHSQSPDYPNIPYATSIDILARDHQMTMLCIYAALKESIAIAKFQLVSITDDMIRFEAVGCRPVALNISQKAENLGPNAWISPEPTVFDVIQIALQQPEIVNVYSQLEPLARLYVSGILETDEDILNSALSKINLIRRFLKENAAAAAITTIEAVFATSEAESIGLTKEFELDTPFAMNIPIVIQGEMSSGKRQFLKNMILQKTKPEDIVLFSSAFNETLDMSIINNLEFITRGLFGPNFDGEIFVCVFDIQSANEEMKKFIKALVMFGSLFFRTFDKFQNVRGIHLICTTTDITLFNDMGVQYYLITEFEQTMISLNDIATNAVRKESLDIVKEYINESKSFHKALEFTKFLQKVRDESDFFALTSYFFGIDIATKAAQPYNFTITQIKRMLNKNKNDCEFLSDKLFASQLSEVLNKNMSALVVTDTIFPATKIPGVNYVVLNFRFRTQLFSALVKAGETKQKHAIIFDMQALNPNEVFNLIDFIVLNNDSTEYSTYFEQADIQIFKYYFDPNNEDLPIFAEVCKYVSFFIVCTQQEYDTIVPELFKRKMVTIRYMDTDDMLKDKELKYPDITNIFKDYISINPYLFESIVEKRYNYFKQNAMKLEHMLTYFVDHQKKIFDMKQMIEDISTGSIISEDQEAKLINQKEDLKAQIEEKKETLNNLNKDVEDKRRKIAALKSKLSKQIPEDHEAAVKSLSSFTSLEQRKMMHEWIDKKDHISEFAHMFVDMFSFTGINNLTECFGDAEDTKLVLAVKKFHLESVDSFQIQKLLNYGLSRAAPPEKLLRKFAADREQYRSPIPLVNYLLDFIHVIMTFVDYSEDVQSLTNSLNEPLFEIEQTNNKIEQLETSLKEVSNRLENQSRNGKCPQWIMDAYLTNSGNVTKAVEIAEKSISWIEKSLTIFEEIDKSVIIWSAFFTAFEFGFGFLTPKKRQEIYSQLGINATPFTSSERMIEQPFLFDIFYPVQKKFSIFSPLSNPETDLISPNTSTMFNSMLVFDSILGTRLLPTQPTLSEKSNIPGYDLPSPFLIYYDPMDFIVETIIGNYPKCSAAFTSSSDSVYSVFVHALSNGYPIIIYIDSYESVHPFFVFARHIMMQHFATGSIIHDGETSKISQTTKIFFVTKLKNVKEPGTVLVDASVENIVQTKWFEQSCVFTVNRQVFEAYTKDINAIETASKQIMSSLTSLTSTDLIPWEIFFQNPSVVSQFQHDAEIMNDSFRITQNSINSMTAITAPSNEHPSSIFRFKQFTSLCVSLANTKSQIFNDDLKNTYTLQVLSSLQEYCRSRDNAPMAPMTTLTGFAEMLFYFTNIIYSYERIQFMVDFERTVMKPSLPTQYLLFEQSFPNVGEKPISGIFQRLLNHVAGRFMSVPRSFFNFATPDTLPLPGPRPVVVIIDSLIPTDLYSRAMSQFLTTKDMTLLTVGSFSNASLSTPMAVNTIVKGCDDKGAMLLVIFDEMMPKYIIHALLHFTHINKFSNYYILVSENLYSKLPHIPNAFITRVCRPTSLFGASRFLNITPYFHRLNIKTLRPFLYFNLIFSHRRDFPLRLQHIIPMVMYTRDLWENNLMNMPSARNLWRNIISSLFGTLTDLDVVKESYGALLAKFFRDPIPLMPSQNKVDFQNDSTYSTELPPTPYEVGMLVSFGDENIGEAKQCWTKQIYKKYFALGKVNGAEIIIEGCTLFNARFKNEMIGSTGENTVTISVLNSPQEENLSPQSCRIDVYDGHEKVGSVSTLFDGNSETLAYSSVFIQLPQKSE